MEKQQQKDQWLRARLGTLIGFFAAFLKVARVVIVGPIFEGLFLSITWLVTAYAVPWERQKTYGEWKQESGTLIPELKLAAYHAQWIMGCATWIVALTALILLQEHPLYGDRTFVIVEGVAFVWGVSMFIGGLSYWFNESEKQ